MEKTSQRLYQMQYLYVEEISVPETSPPIIVVGCIASLEDILVELGLNNHLKNFEDEGVDIDMLLSLKSTFEIKDCLKEIGIKRFGDRH